MCWRNLVPLFKQGNVSISYEVRGAGAPLLLLAPGGMDATMTRWQGAAFNPLEIFSQDFRVVALDERNAGGSTGPLGPGDPWATYLSDHLGLLNHLGIERCLLLGFCVGCSHALRMACAVPDRVRAAVLAQPIGIDAANADKLPRTWEGWGEAMCADRSDLDRPTVELFGRSMWERDFVLSVDRAQLAICVTPLLVLPGIDLAHPTSIGREIAAIAPGAESIEPWKQPAELVPSAVARIRAFLHRHEND
jgi:pimeloyl-ACP methyl ester carboxylesterase